MWGSAGAPEGLDTEGSHTGSQLCLWSQPAMETARQGSGELPWLGGTCACCHTLEPGENPM